MENYKILTWFKNSLLFSAALNLKSQLTMFVL